MDRKFEIKESTINSILQYLSKQPYQEVAPLIGGLINECNSQLLVQPQISKPEVVVDNSEK